MTDDDKPQYDAGGILPGGGPLPIRNLTRKIEVVYTAAQWREFLNGA